MNFTIIRALLEDSRQQVLDNKVFRLLIILTAVPILLTFVVGFYPDRMVIPGFDPIFWKDFAREFGLGAAGEDDMGSAAIQWLQSLVVNFFAGSLGIMFCIAATAFFMPRVLEKGAADTLFSKPVSRLSILLSRYFAGLLFIAGIALVLVFGMFLGFGVRSSYWDPGFLWGAITLVYLFGMMHAFSICVAVLTRSSTAAILMTIVLFFISGGVHGGWSTIEYFKHLEAQQVARSEKQAGPKDEADVDEDTALEAEGAEEEADDEPGVVVSTLIDTLYALHYTLPKTSDADIITNKLRRAITEAAPEFVSNDEELTISEPPKGFLLEASSAGSLEVEGVRWAGGAGATEASVNIKRFTRPQVERGSNSRKRMVDQTGSTRAKDLKKELGDREDLLSGPNTISESLAGIRMVAVRWSENIDDLAHDRERLIFHFGDWMYEVDFDTPAGFDIAEEGAEQRRERFIRPRNFVLGSDEMMLNPEQWYTKQFSWNSPWRFNIFFSIGSSLAFILAMLSLSWLRLRKVDF